MSITNLENVIKRNVGDKSYFIGTLPSNLAKAATFVPVVEDSETYLDQRLENGYQRPGKKSRMNQFKNYLKKHSNRLIPPIILSARGKWKFTSTNDNVGNIDVIGKAAIVDGQHRVGGIVAHFEETNDPINFDFICFENLSLDEEKEEFKTINGKQVGVPKALQEYLGEDPNSLIAWNLNEHDDSPFYKRITRTTMGPNHLFALHSVAKNVARTFAHGTLEDIEDNTKLDILIRYWTQIKSSNQIAWQDAGKENKREHKYKLLELTGNIAWSLIAPQILLKGYNPNEETFDWAEIENIIQFISQDMDWEKEGEFYGLTGEVGGRKIAKHLENALSFYQ